MGVEDYLEKDCGERRILIFRSVVENVFCEGDREEMVREEGINEWKLSEESF